jgi:hypothetical protein
MPKSPRPAIARIRLNDFMGISFESISLQCFDSEVHATQGSICLAATGRDPGGNASAVEASD